MPDPDPDPGAGRMPEAHCPTCDEKLDAVTSIDADGMPERGDISLCAYCGEILEFDDNMQLIVITEEAWEITPQHTKNEIIKVQQIVRSKDNPFE